MDNVINDLILILETEIVEINNIISKVNVTSSLEKIGSLFNEESVWDLTIDNVEKLKNNLHGDNELSYEEESFLYSFVNMPLEVKELKKSFFGLGDEHKKILDAINFKINSVNEVISDVDLEEEKDNLEKYKIILGKLKNNTVSLITEIDLIIELLNKNNIPLKNQIEIFTNINNINAKIFEKYGIRSFEEDDDEVVLSENDLIETNISLETLQQLLERFGIKWELKEEECKTESDRVKKQKKLDINFSKLLKYGDYNKMVELLEFIVDNKLTFVFKNLEVLSKTLLFSSADRLKEIKVKSIQNGVDFREILKKNPAIFYPIIREVDRTVKVGSKTGGSSNLTGALNYYMGNVEFLREKGYPVADVIKDCPTICGLKTKTIRKVHKKLSLYGISFWKPNGELREGFTVLSSLGVLDRLDIGIESNSICYSWFQDNLSKLKDSDKRLNLYMIKLETLKGTKDIFMKYPGHKHELVLKQKYRCGQKVSETFKKYGAIEPEFELKDVYESIINNSDNDTISNIALKDSMIEQLDVLYKTSDFVYNFKGVIISRLKVLRNYQTLISSANIVPSKDALLYSIVRLSMLNQEEYDNIRECMEQVKFKGRG